MDELVDLGLHLASDGSMTLDGAGNLGALFALSASSLAVYALSASVDRSIDQNGNVIGGAAAPSLSFARNPDGSFTSAGGYDLVQSASGFTVTQAGGTALAFDAAGHLLSVQTGAGQHISVTADAGGHVVSFIAQNGRVLTLTRDATGHVMQASDSDGATTSFVYGPGGSHLIATSGAAGTTGFGYSGDGDLVSVDRAGTAPTDMFAYDGQGRLVSVSTASGLQSETFAYDHDGGYVDTDGAGVSTRVQLVTGGLAARVTDALGAVSALRFDAEGNLTGSSDANGGHQTYTLDAQGRVGTVTDATGATLSFTYTGSGSNPASVTDANGHSRSFSYDAAGHLTGATWPDGTRLTLVTDADGNVTGYSNRRGDGTTYTYDAQGRVTSASDSPAGAASYGYDAHGRVASVTTSAGVTTLDYDAAGHVTHIGYPGGRSLTYVFDDAGRRTSMTDQDGHRQTYGYDAAGRLATLGDEHGTLVTYHYNTGGDLVREDKANGTFTTYANDAAGHLTAIDNHAPDASVSSFVHYSYDAGGLRTTEDTQDGHWVYGYDASGQLTAADFTSARSGLADKHLSWTYDAAGNRTRSVEDGAMTLYTTNSLNQYTQVGSDTLAYDADGNLISRTGPAGTTTYGYDAANRITSVTTPDGHASVYEYDIFGNRSAVVQDGVRTEYLNDPSGLGNIVGSYDSSGSLVSSYQYGFGLATETDLYGTHSYYESDGVGSITSVTNAVGVSTNSYAYSPFGTLISKNESVINIFQYGGKLGVSVDAGGVSNIRMRDYDSSTGRFLSEDPLLQLHYNKNLYYYADNNPVLLTDPSGKIVVHAGFSFSFSFFGKVYGFGVGVFHDTDSDISGVYSTYREGHGVAASAGADVGVSNSLSGFGGNSYYVSTPYGEGSLGNGFGLSLTPNLGIDVSAGRSETTYLDLQDFVDYLLDPAHDPAPQYPPLPLPGPGDPGYDPNMDTDGDGIPDGRDPHPNTPDPDRDGDGIPDDEDPHPDTPDPDRDGDGIPDDVDPHPDTPDPRPRPAHSSGDPHLRTFDGLAYDFQALGEFVSVKGRGFEVQTRQVPLNDLVSYNSAVAIRFGAITVQLNATGDRLLVNGRPVDLAPLSAVQVGDGSIYRSDDGTGQPTYTVSDGHGNGITVAVTSWLGHALLDVTAFVAGNQAGQVSGLLGNADGDAADDIRLADGTVLHAPVVTRDLYGVFADSWRVTDATSLFTYAAGETTATYTDSSFPHALVTVDGLDPAARAAGEAAAMAAGLMPGTVAYENAVLDVALIGDPTVVVSAASTAAGPEPQKLDLDQAPAFAGPLLVVIVANTASAPLAIGASDADADPLSFAVKSGAQPAKGSVTINQADGSLVYTPQHDAIGSDGFILVVSDGRGGTTEQYVSVAITPVASPDITTTTEDARIVSASLFGNDTNADGSLRVAAVNGVAANVGTRIPLASGAWLTVRADGSYDYDPNHAFDSLTTVAGATNHTGVDSFTYSVVGGNTVSVTVTITGANSPGDQAQGTAGNDTLTGTASSEYFNLSAGGDDTASGGAGADTFFLGAAFTAADRIDGGSGNDQIGLQGNYTGANALVLSPTTVTNVETIALLGNFSYDLTTNDANIAASQTMAFYGSELQAGTTFTLNASAETDGRVLVYGGLGADTITTGAGNDGIYFGRGGRFDPTTDHVDGGAGTDQFALDGSYTVTISGQQIVNIETLALLDGTPSTPAIYNVTLADDWATGSQTKTIYFADVRSDAIVDGSAETSANFTFFGGRGNDIIKGGAGNDTIYGGPGADTLTGGAGADTFAYTAVSDSIGTSHDIIVGFDPSQDKIDLPFTVTGIDAATSGNASAGTLDTDLTNALATLASHHAVQFTATGGDLAGHVFEVIDANGVAGYQAGQDVVIELQAPVAPIIHPTPFI